MRTVFTARPVAMARVPLTPAMGVPSPGLLAEGVFLASRSLDNAAPSPRAASALAAYSLRAGARTTPNSVWCAVGTAVLDGTASTTVTVAEDPRALTLPSPAWLLAVADHCLPAALTRLTVTANNLAVRRGDRWEVAHTGEGGGAVLGSVAATELSDWLLAECAAPVAVRQLLAAIVDRYPGAEDAKARRAVTDLVRTGLLLTDLLPEDLRIDPLHHLVQRLGPGRPARALLTELRRLLNEADRHAPGATGRLALLRRARDLADGLCVTDRPFTVDTVMDSEVHMPSALGTRAAEAASVLWRIGHRAGPLAEWTRRFTATYGRHRRVPLLEAIDPATGIGAPAGQDAVGAFSDLDDRRCRHLAALFTAALACGRPEVALTEDDVRCLEAPEGPAPPPTAEIHVRPVRRPDGSTALVVGPHAAQDAGSAAARLGHLLPGLLAAAPPGGSGEAVPAEIVCRPLTARAAALTTAGGTLTHRIPVGVAPRDGDLRLADLTVASHGTELVLWSEQLGAPVRPVLLSRITRELLPPPAQLLHLLGHTGERPWHPFTWTPVFPYAAYTPRVTYRGTVLAPQRWALPDDLMASTRNRSLWAVRLDKWLDHVRPSVPRLVLTEQSDRHLLVDLADPAHAEILRRTVAAGARTVAEAIGHAPSAAPATGPRGPHLLELVVQLDRRPKHAAVAAPDPRTTVRPRRRDLAGPPDGWTSAALAVPAPQQNSALLRLPDLPGVRLTYWLRYRTAALGPHLRVRAFAVTRDDRTAVEEALTGWAELLADQNLSDGLLHFEPYVRETQRYGGPDSIESAERFFSCDSALARAALHRDEPDRLIIAARTITIVAATLSPNRAQTAVRAQRLGSSERYQRDRLRPQARKSCGIPVSARVEREWRAALAELAGRLPPHVSPGVASDLVHMHCNRLLGADASLERTARSLAADLLHAS
ncbi:lantibiotic dehydratase [Streptomyces sp. NPDC021020]|uniref:lantibiotic dehydratase n=1 Tax=Streptomyces sp. NPDC021020 TaxID=3365109 RepID=UPI0037AE6AA9